MTSFDWTPLRHALTLCRDMGVSVPLWWRDDDTVAMTPALAQLTELARKSGLPVHLAIIPAHVDETLVGALDLDHLLPVVHGWAHQDHGLPSEKKNEFQTPRPNAIKESQAAIDKMADIFGPGLRRMFVPPWNRINAEMTGALAAQGYRALSTYGARSKARVAGLDLINTHVDPIWWKGSRDLADPDHLIAEAAAHLTARAHGQEDADEPFGLLTHHLVHTPAVWSFVEAFITEMQTGGACPWLMENDI